MYSVAFFRMTTYLLTVHQLRHKGPEDQEAGAHTVVALALHHVVVATTLKSSRSELQGPSLVGFSGKIHLRGPSEASLLRFL